VPVRLAEPTALALVRPGDRVDLVRVEEGGTTTPVAQGALVLGITGAGDPLPGDPLPGDPLPGDPLAGDPRGGDPPGGDPLAGDPLAGGLLLALDPGTAKRAVATPSNGFAVLLRPD
jgi:hypothetical protein